MKKRKTLLAFLLALSFLASTTALFACNDNQSPELQLPSSGLESSAPNVPEQEETEQSPESSTPNAPEQEEQKPTPTPPATTVRYSQYIRCTGNSVNLRSGAGTGYAVLGAAGKNETYALVGKSGEWYQTYYRGKTAYISASYAAVLKLEKSESEKTEKVISEGYKLLGVPYVYGAVRLHDGKGNLLSGFTSQKFDCSSLIQYVFYKGAGAILDVTTRTQVKQGKYVAKSDLQRGDCIYFTNESRAHLSGVERVGHVALYLGDNYILHTASDYARIEQISAQRWKYYIEARRFL